MPPPRFKNASGQLLPDVADAIVDKLKLPPGTTFGSRIGSNSVNGAIFPINGQDKVIKVGLVHEDDYLHDGGRGDFAREVKIGRKFADMNANNRRRVGTPIHQSGTIKMYDTSGQPYILTVYVMDNLLTAANRQRGYTLMTLREYQKTIYTQRTNHPNTCPKDRITRMYTELLYYFYKGVEGWHGDLHAENIQVILNSRGVPVRMVVIDYGSSKYFKNRNRLKSARCLDKILDQIHEESSSLPKYPGVFWTEPHRVNPGNVMAKTLVKRSQLVYPNSTVMRNRVALNQPLYHSARVRGHTTRNLNKNDREAALAKMRKARRNAVLKAVGKVSKTVYNTGCSLGAKACSLLEKRKRKVVVVQRKTPMWVGTRR